MLRWYFEALIALKKDPRGIPPSGFDAASASGSAGFANESSWQEPTVGMPAEKSQLSALERRCSSFHESSHSFGTIDKSERQMELLPLES